MRILAILVLLFYVSHVDCKLVQVAIVTRSGARYPLNDYYDGIQTKQQWGELSAVGMRQHQTLGDHWRRDYGQNNPLLNLSAYIKNESEFYATTSNRSIMSAMTQASAIYYLSYGPKLIYVDRKYHLPPFTNTTDSTEQNYALPKGQLSYLIKFNRNLLIQSCPNYNIQVEKNIKLQITDYNQMVITYTPFLKKIAAIFQTDALNFTKLNQLYDTLNADKYLGRALPTNLSQSDFQNMEHLHNWYNRFTVSHNLSKMYNSYKIEKILADFDARIKSPSGYALKYLSLTAHEQDLSALHLAFNLSSYACIEDLYRKGSTSALNCMSSTQFASSIAIELHSDDGKSYYVRVRSNGKYANLCGASKKECDYNDWKARVKKQVITNVQDVCGKAKMQQNQLMHQDQIVVTDQ